MLPPTNQRQHPIRDLTDHKDLDNMIPVIAKMVMVLKGSKISYHKSKRSTLRLNLYIN